MGESSCFEDHLDRLFDSAKAILLTIPMERDELRAATLEDLFAKTACGMATSGWWSRAARATLG